MYDQLAGGFARYCVDAGWVVPHFEKMLYDNAQLLRVYLHLWRATGSPLAERISRQSADFLLRDLGTGHGGFASSLDADTDGVEGLTYVWTAHQLVEVLGEPDGGRAVSLLEVTGSGTFEHGMSTLQLRTERRTRGGGKVFAAVCWPRAVCVPSRPWMTRWSPAGTGWPSLPSAKPACCWEIRRTWMPPGSVPSSSPTRTW